MRFPTLFSDAGFTFQEKLGVNGFEDENITSRGWLTNNKVDPMHYFDSNGNAVRDTGAGPYLPTWQTSPVLKYDLVNEDLLLNQAESAEARVCYETEAAVLGGFILAPSGDASSSDQTTSFFASLRSIWEGKETKYDGDPMARLKTPVFDSFNETSRKVVAVMFSVIHWQSYFVNILPSNVNGITVVLENACDGFYTYELNGQDAVAVGFGDHHETSFNDLEKIAVFDVETLKDGTTSGIKFNQHEGCAYSLHVYPSSTFYNEYVDRQPIIITFAVALVFMFTILMFLVYDRLVERRQSLVLAKATQSHAIISSLFPKNVRDRLMNVESETGRSSLSLAPNHRLKTFLRGSISENEASQPIADLFPHCTVFFADIAGFTAWSSTREPAQVFVLLQAVYQAFDHLAKRRKVFKVETIGDSYVAVTGLPEAQPNHAVIMSRFAWECSRKVCDVVKQLEVSLGPGTGKHIPPIRLNFSPGQLLSRKLHRTVCAMHRGPQHEIWPSLRPGDSGSVKRRKGSIPTFW